MSQLDRVIASPPAAVLKPREVDRAGAARDLATFCKSGIVKMVTITGAVGFAMGALSRNWSTLDLVITGGATLVGVALSAAGANALNQVMERRRDALMHRTRERPIPAGRLTVSRGWWVGVMLCILGVLTLLVGANPWAAALSTASILSYLLWYTPLKPVTSLATLVGAIPGALPPLIGWSAAATSKWGGLDELGGWSLFAILFVWQVPHFLALAWKYRDDYTRGGYPVLPAGDVGGRRTARAVIIWTIAMLPVSLSPVYAMHGLLGPIYTVVALLAGAWFLYAAFMMARERTDRSARTLFFASIIYLPVVMLAMVGDALVSSL